MEEITVVVGEDLVGDGEMIEGGIGERAELARGGVTPEGLRGGEVLGEHGTEAGVLDEVVLAAFFSGIGGTVLPQPFDVGLGVFVGLLFGAGKVELGAGGSGDGEEEGEMEEAAHRCLHYKLNADSCGQRQTRRASENKNKCDN